MKIKPNWEHLLDSGTSMGDCRRMKVIGGWVFNTWTKDIEGEIVSESACFIPDPEHKWEVK